MDKDLKHIEKPDNILELNIKPQDFLFNHFIPCLLSSSCTYHLRTILKDNLKIINNLKWANQNRIKYWTKNIRDIQWPSTLLYISFEEKPLSLQTNPTYSKLKNFKVKLLAEELPNYLTLYYCNPDKHKNYLCPRCLKELENNSHLISYIRNSTTIDSLIRDTILITSQELELMATTTRDFIAAFKYLHIQQEVPLGIITSATLAPFDKYSDKIKYVPLIHHLIIKSIYQEIWLPSRQITHTIGFPIPAPLLLTSPPNTIPLSHSHIISKLQQYVNFG